MHIPDNDYSEHVIDFYKQRVDRAAIRENLKLSPEERLLKLQRALNAMEPMREEPSASPRPE